jgi:molybdenum cofactor cytidylyltransferase
MAALKLSAIVLAAGRSSRMGDRHKLLLDIGGQTMIRRSVETVLAIAPVETIVVTGHEAAAITAALDGLPIRLVHNPHWPDGQPTSVAAGVRALEQPCQAVMVVPGDQVLLTPAHLTALVTAFGRIGERSILVPCHRGQRGNPILFAARHGPEVTSGGLNIGCRHLIETNGDKVARVEFDSDAYSVDCDTPADYAALAARLAGAAACAT